MIATNISYQAIINWLFETILPEVVYTLVDSVFSMHVLDDVNDCPYPCRLGT